MDQELRNEVATMFQIDRLAPPQAVSKESILEDSYEDADKAIRMVARDILEDMGYLIWQDAIVARCLGDERDIGARDALLYAARWIYQIYIKEEEWNYTD